MLATFTLLALQWSRATKAVFPHALYQPLLQHPWESKVFRLRRFCVRVTRLHASKLLALTLFIAAVLQISAAGFVFLLLFFVFLVFDTPSRLVVILLATLMFTFVVAGYILSLPCTAHSPISGAWIGFGATGRAGEVGAVVVVAACAVYLAASRWTLLDMETPDALFVRGESDRFGGVMDFIENFSRRFSGDMALISILVAAFSHNNMYNMIYLVIGAVLTIAGSKRLLWVCGAVVMGVELITRYALLLYLPPPNNVPPWSALSPDLVSFLGLDPASVFFGIDFIMLFLMSRHIKNLGAKPVPAVDSTPLELGIMRLTTPFCIAITFFAGLAEVNLLSLPYLAFGMWQALYALPFKSFSRAWWALKVYNYAVLVAKAVYQAPFIAFAPMSLNVSALVGLTKLPVDGGAFGLVKGGVLTHLLVFLFTLWHRRAWFSSHESTQALLSLLEAERGVGVERGRAAWARLYAWLRAEWHSVRVAREDRKQRRAELTRRLPAVSTILYATPYKPEEQEEDEGEEGEETESFMVEQQEEDSGDTPPRWRRLAAWLSSHWMHAPGDGNKGVLLLLHVIRVNTLFIASAVAFLTVVFGRGILYIPIAILLFCVSLTSYPRPTRTVWNMLIGYTMLLIAVQTIIQLPLFCTCDSVRGPVIALWFFCDENAACEIPPVLGTLTQAGLWGLPRVNDPVFIGHVLWPLALLVVLFVHRWAEQNDGAPVVVESAGSCGELKGETERQGVVQWLVHGSQRGRVGKDLYLPMFVTDFLAWLFTALFFPSLFTRSTAVVNFEQNVTIPGSYVMAIFIPFLLIVLDRIIYLKRWIGAKIVMQWGQVVGYNVWIFILLPTMTGIPTDQNFELITLYVLKTLYMAASALQIHHGFAATSLDDYFVRRGGYAMYTLRLVYRAIPFLSEMRVLLDWTCTETSLILYDWLKLNDIMSQLFAVKANYTYWKASPREVGDRQPGWYKLVCGLLIFVLLLSIIWFPLFILSSANPTLQSNRVTSASIAVSIDGFPELYRQTELHNFANVTMARWNVLRVEYHAPQLDEGDLENVEQVEWGQDSDYVWGINPPSMLGFEARLRLCEEGVLDMWLVSDIRLVRPLPAEGQAIETGFRRKLSEGECSDLVDAVVSNDTVRSVSVPRLIPRFLDVPISGDLTASAGTSGVWVDAMLTRHRSSSAPNAWYWTCAQQVEPEFPPGGVAVMLANSRIPSGIGMGFIATAGVIGLYVGLILSIGRFVRMWISSSSSRIMLEDLPAADELLTQVHDITWSRVDGDLVSEELLYRDLLDTYRVPERLVERTKLKDE